MSNAHRCWIGFDLDHTLIEFDNDAMEKIMYDSVRKTLASLGAGAARETDVNLLVTKAGLEGVVASSYEKHLTSKGMIIDIANGNLLILDENKKVKIAFHGTKLLTGIVAGENGFSSLEEVTLSEEIVDSLDRLCFNIVVVLEEGAAPPPVPKKSVAMIHTNFDRPIGPAFAHAVDGIDEAYSKLTEPDKAAVSLREIYESVYAKLVDAFLQSQSGFTPTSLTAHLQDDETRARLIRKQKATRTWLGELKKRGFNTFLLSDARATHVDTCMREAYGAEWRSLFDLVVCDAKKTAFFASTKKKTGSGASPFSEVKWDAAGAEVTGGHYTEMLECFMRKSADCQVTYFGDHLAKDVVAPKLLKLPNWRSVAVVKERRSGPSSSSTLGGTLRSHKRSQQTLSPLTLSPASNAIGTSAAATTPGSPLQLAARLIGRTFSSPRLSRRKAAASSSVSSAGEAGFLEDTVFFAEGRSYFHATLDAYADGCYTSLSEAAATKLFLVNDNNNNI